MWQLFKCRVAVQILTSSYNVCYTVKPDCTSNLILLVEVIRTVFAIAFTRFVYVGPSITIIKFI